MKLSLSGLLRFCAAIAALAFLVATHPTQLCAQTFVPRPLNPAQMPAPADFMIGGMIEDGNFHGPSPIDILNKHLEAGFNTFWNWRGFYDYTPTLSLLPKTMFGINGACPIESFINQYTSVFSSEFRLFVATNDWDIFDIERLSAAPNTQDPPRSPCGDWKLKFSGSQHIIPISGATHGQTFYQVKNFDGPLNPDGTAATDPSLALDVELSPMSYQNQGLESRIGIALENAYPNSIEPNHPCEEILNVVPSDGSKVDFIYSINKDAPFGSGVISGSPNYPLYYLTYTVTYQSNDNYWPHPSCSTLPSRGARPSDFTLTYTISPANQTVLASSTPDLTHLDVTDPFIITYGKWANYSDPLEHPYVTCFPKWKWNTTQATQYKYAVLRTATAAPGMTGSFFPDVLPVWALACGSNTTGTFKLKFRGSSTTDIPIANADHATVQTALNASGMHLNSGEQIVCTGGPLPTTPILIQFGGSLAGQPQPAIYVDNSSISGDQVTDFLNASQCLTSTATSGSFTLSFGGYTTASLPWNADPGSVEKALQGLQSIGQDNITCGGGPLPYPIICTFAGAKQGTEQLDITVNTSSNLIKITRNDLPIRPYFPVKIRCELHNLGVVDMYVRGWRIRSEMADDILRGKKDACLQAVIRGYTHNLGSSNSANMQMITSSAEILPEGMRVMSYIDRLFQKTTGGKQFFNFNRPPDDFDITVGSVTTHHAIAPFARSIYEDENGPYPNVKPAILVTEGGVGGDARQSDAIPTATIDRLDKYDPSLDPDPFALLATSTFKQPWSESGAGSWDFSKYIDYTNSYQAGAQFQWDNYKYLASASKGDSYIKWVSDPFIVGGVVVKDGATITVPDAVRTAVWQKFKQVCDNPGPRCGDPTKMESASTFNPQLYYKQIDGLSLTGTGGSAVQSEMRMDFWMALANGSRGYFYNTFGSNERDEEGLTDVLLGTDYDGPNDDPDPTDLLCRAPGIRQYNIIPIPPLAADDYDSYLVELGNGNWNNPCDPSPEPCPAEVCGTTGFLPLQWIPITDYNNFDQSKLPSEIADYFLNSKNETRTIWYWGCDAPTTAVIGFSTTPSGQTWYGVTHGSPPGPTVKGFSKINPRLSWQSYDFPSANLKANIRANAFYGYKERWTGAKTAVKDIVPISKTYAKLQWQKSIDLKDVDFSNPATMSDWTTFPIKEYMGTDVNGNPQDHTVQKFWRYSGVPRDPSDHVDLAPHNIEYVSSIDGVATNAFDAFTSKANDASGHPDVHADKLIRLGLFTNPEEQDAEYFVVTNCRTWTVRYRPDGKSIQQSDPESIYGTPANYVDLNNTNHNRHLLGAIDRRRFNFKVRTNLSGQNWANVPYFSVTNCSTGEEKIIAAADPCFVDLDPGQGALVRIAPANSLVLGKTSAMGMGYNNGHRVAEVQFLPGIEPPCSLPLTDRAVCYESNGSVQLCLVAPAGQPAQVFDNYKSSNNPSMYHPITLWTPPDPQHQGHNPSIGAKGDTVVVIFSVDDFDTYTFGERSVIAIVCTPHTALPPQNNSWDTTWVRVAKPGYGVSGFKDVTGGNADLLVPVTTPACDGFMCAYTHYNKFEPTWIHLLQPMGQPVEWAKYNVSMNGFGGWHVRMTSLASSNECNSTDHLECFHFAWEIDKTDGTSAILYRRLDHTTGTDNFSLASPNNAIMEVSKGYPTCTHRHPMVTVSEVIADGHSAPLVTWEVTDPASSSGGPPPSLMAMTGVNDSYKLGPTSTPAKTKVLLRELYSYSPPTWGPITAFHPVTNNLPLPAARAEDRFCSHIFAGIHAEAPYLLRELVYQDTLVRQVFLARTNNLYNWQSSRLEENAQLGSLSLPYTDDPLADLGSITYRGIYADQNNLYSAKIVADPPNGETPDKTTLVQFYAVSSLTGAACYPYAVMYGNGPGHLVYPMITMAGADTTITADIPWLYQPIGLFSATPVDDSTATLVQTQWPQTEDSARTDYFRVTDSMVLDMNRLLLVDTSAVPSVLQTPGSIIALQLVVKDSASGQITQVIDSAILHSAFAQGGSYPGVDINDTTSTGIGYHIHTPINLTPSGSAYLTIRITKDNQTQAELRQVEQFGDDILLPAPSTDTDAAQKRAHPTPSTPQFPQGGLSMRVYPNPTTGLTEIDVLELTKDMPVKVQVYDLEENIVATLYDGTPSGDSGLRLQFDGTKLPSGTYLIGIQDLKMGRMVKLQVIR